MDMDTLTDPACIREDAERLKRAVTGGATFTEAIVEVTQARGLGDAPPAWFLTDIFAEAFGVPAGECGILGGWLPGGAGEIDDARLTRDLTNVVVEFSSDRAFVRQTTQRLFRGRSVNDGSEEYLTVERRSDDKEVVRANSLELSDRVLRIDYEVLENSIFEPVAEALILNVLILDLSSGMYDGKVDSIVWVNAGGSEHTTQFA